MDPDRRKIKKCEKNKLKKMRKGKGKIEGEGEKEITAITKLQEMPKGLGKK